MSNVKIYNTQYSNTMATVVTTCHICGGSDSMLLPKAKLQAWLDGALIQDVFPDLTPNRREQLISGTHGRCFDAVFADDDYDAELYWEEDEE